MGPKFTKDNEEALERRVKSDLIDGLGPSAVQQMYKSQFGELNTRTFGNRLCGIRKRFGKDLSKSRGMN